MTFDAYMRDVAEEMRRKSAAIRRDFAAHRPSAGSNREDLVATFLREHLPERFGVGTGLIVSHDGEFSNEADLVVFDKLNNSPLYPGVNKKLWPVEAIYALIEVRTQLSPRDVEDVVLKVRRFKKLRRRFRAMRTGQYIADSLAIIWSFESPNPVIVKETLVDALSQVSSNERPDFVVVPDKLVARSGSYLELSMLGQENSPHRDALVARHGSDLSSLVPDLVEVYDLGANSLMGWYVWMDSWLRQAGERFPDPAEYLPKTIKLGERI